MRLSKLQGLCIGYFLCVICIFALGVRPVIAQQKMPAVFYFSSGWCPRPEELAEIARYLDLVMNGCCIYSGEANSLFASNPDSLAQWKDKIYSHSYKMAACTGKVLTQQEEGEINQANEKAFAEVREQAKREHIFKMNNASEVLQRLSINDFCVVYGDGLRGNYMHPIGLSSEALPFLMKEAKRRKISVDRKLVIEGRIRIGMSECSMYASLGFPKSKNQSVGSWGIHTQHVYPYGFYVYTENGVVTSWQN